MKTKEDIVIGAVKHWWRTKRPAGWTVRRHIDEPFINTTNEGEKQLAGAISFLIKQEQDEKLKEYKISGLTITDSNLRKKCVFFILKSYRCERDGSLKYSRINKKGKWDETVIFKTYDLALRSLAKIRKENKKHEKTVKNSCKSL